MASSRTGPECLTIHVGDLLPTDGLAIPCSVPSCLRATPQLHCYRHSLAASNRRFADDGEEIRDPLRGAELKI
jgi:hypothetical protein